MRKKAIVIGLDGLEPTIVESMLDRGELPNLARIRQMGSYSRLKTTYPAQTPVAWSSFATGTNPGGHGIFDFISRDPATYLPDAALSHFERPKNMFAPPRVVNQRRGDPVWHALTAEGVPSVVLRCPCTFPPDQINGRMLAGVGVPDIRGAQSKGTFYTQDKNTQAHESEQVVILAPGDELKTYVIGPRNTRQSPPADALCEIKVRVVKDRRLLIIETSGAPERIEIHEKSWSGWVRFKFKLSMLQSVAGIARVYVKQLEPQLEFYVSAVNFDPDSPLFPVSSPTNYAKDLAGEIGLFSTLGMAEDHNGLNNGRFDERAYLAQCELVLEERERLMRFELGRFKEGFFFLLYDTPDRVQHMLWRLRDREHPGHEPDLARDFSTAIEEHYACCDRLLSSVLDKVDENTFLIVLSDHGFNAFRRAFDTNTWLWQNGLLALKNGRKPSEESGDAFGSVDWSRTYAYAVGLGGIYLNLKGREREGILEEGTEAERIRTAIQSGLAGFSDAQKQQIAIRNVSRREELYSGPYVANAPDLLVNFCAGFRVSWQSAVGGFAKSLFEDNIRRWSGDHIIDPDAVPGILFMNQNPHPVAKNATRMGHPDQIPNIIDLAPTILNYLGVPIPQSMEGISLL
ncbi:MAG TPA: alkaline phosphatase family protein [Terriglobales bacterium]|nr:alkaline phosphatase family protein [Terriglobales bacterium]